MTFNPYFLEGFFEIYDSTQKDPHQLFVRYGWVVLESRTIAY